jgi:hypothetical protein
MFIDYVVNLLSKVNTTSKNVWTFNPTSENNLYYATYSDAAQVSFKKYNRAKVVQDHLGNYFPSVKDMCAYYKVPLGTYYVRKRQKYPIAMCLCQNIQLYPYEHRDKILNCA